MGFMGYDGPKASKYDVTTLDGRQAYAREIIPGYAEQIDAEANDAPKPAGRSPSELARHVVIVRFADAYGVKVTLGADWDEYFVDKNVSLERARVMARQVRKTLILAAWSILTSEVESVLTDAAKGDP